MVRIDQEKCIGCDLCVDVCGVGAISFVYNVGRSGRKALVDAELCVECGACTREICPVDAITKTPLSYPRSIRIISDPTVRKLTGIPGRGTEESKTNDVTGRVGHGEVGFCIDIGRPGVGATLRDVQTITSALAGLGIVFEEDNPSTALMQDQRAGLLNPDIIEEHVLSIIVEFKCSFDEVASVIAKLRDVEPRLNTVFSLGLVSRFDEYDSIEALPVLEKLGIGYRPNAKINVGLGRPLRMG